MAKLGKFLRARWWALMDAGVFAVFVGIFTPYWQQVQAGTRSALWFYGLLALAVCVLVLLLFRQLQARIVTTPAEIESAPRVTAGAIAATGWVDEARRLGGELTEERRLHVETKALAADYESRVRAIDEVLRVVSEKYNEATEERWKFLDALRAVDSELQGGLVARMSLMAAPESNKERAGRLEEHIFNARQAINAALAPALPTRPDQKTLKAPNEEAT